MDTFYDTSKLSLPQKIERLNDCKAVCCNWWIDKLDCSQSFNRQGAIRGNHTNAYPTGHILSSLTGNFICGTRKSILKSVSVR
jgi:hypothetical protein